MIVNDTWQLIHVTATLPIILEETWMTLVGINRGRTTILRGPTNRPELSYNILHVNPKERHIESVAEHLIRMLEEVNQVAEGRRILFVASKASCDTLAKQFGCFKHHSGMSKDDKHNHLEGQKSGKVMESNGRE